MANETAIEWTHMPGFTGATWNPVTGCTKIASGCKHCYAATIAKRFWGDRKFTDVQTHADRLDQPLRRRKPTCYFVNSMSDLFHDAVPFEFIAAVYGVMAACPQHTFIILTKRPKRMREFMEWLEGQAFGVPNFPARRKGKPRPMLGAWPLPNVIHGYSAATQADLDAGIADLLATPSALRGLSLEPLIGPVDVTQWLGNEVIAYGQAGRVGITDFEVKPPRLHWVIVGGESGPGARPCDVAWIRGIVEQCKAAAVPCFVKQLGARPVYDGGPAPSTMTGLTTLNVRVLKRLDLKDRKGGNMAEWPDDLRVREWPKLEVTQ